MLPLLFWSARAAASASSLHVGGAAAARTVAVLLQRGDDVSAVPCSDAGVAPDDAADGVWTCGPVDPSVDPVHVGVLVDGRLLDAGTSPLPAGGLALVVDHGRVVCSTDLAVLPAPVPRAAPAPARTVLARVSGLDDGPAPVVRLRGTSAEAELSCHDDGTFPDATRNDGAPGCAGSAPEGPVSVFLNGKDGQAIAVGTVTWDPTETLHCLTIDAAARTVSSAAFSLEPFPPADAVPSGTPVATPPPVVAGPTPPTTPTPPPGAPQPTAGSSGSMGQHLALLVTAVLGFGGAFSLGRRRARLPASLRPLPVPPLLPGGPSLTDTAVAVHTSDVTGLGGALLANLARHRRVVVVAPAGLALPAVADGPVYVATASDCEQVEAAVRALAHTPGPAVAVLILGADALTDPGAVAADPLGKLRRGLPIGVWFGIVSADDVPDGVPCWEAAGPPWALAPVARAIVVG